MSHVRDERVNYRNLKSKEKDRKIGRSARTGALVGLSAGLGGAALAGRGVNAGRGAAWALKNARGRKGVLRLATQTGARIPNKKFERATTGIPQAAVGMWGGAYAGQEISSRKQYPGYRRTQYGLAPVGRNKKVQKNMTTSVWGVDHGQEVSKKEGGKAPEHASFGRYAAAGVFPGWHGAIAGKRGKKLKATGYELGGALLIPGPGGAVGAHFAQKKGYYKKQQVEKLFRPILNKGPAKPSVANGIKMASQPMGPKPMAGAKPAMGARAKFGGPSQAQFGPAASRIQARSRFNTGQQSALGSRIGKNLEDKQEIFKKEPLITDGMRRRGAASTLATAGGITGAVVTRGRRRAGFGALAAAGVGGHVYNGHVARDRVRARGGKVPGPKSY